MKNRLFPVLLICAFLLPQEGRAQSVTVRAGQHERSNRLVFDWTKNVGYSVNQNGNTVRIQFNTPSKAQFAGVSQLPYIKNLKQESTAQGLLITFQMPNDAKLETFRLGNKTAFDIVRAKKTPPKFAPASPAPAAATPEPSPEPKPEEVAAPTPPPAPAANVLPPPPEQPNAPPASSAPRLQTLADRLAGIEPPTSPAAQNTTQPAAADQVTSGTRITVNPGDYTKLAAFVRAGKLWLVLDKALPDFMPKIEGEGLSALTKNARRVDQPKATAFVFDAIPDAVYSTKRDQADWQIWINAADKKYLPDDIPVNVNQEKNADATVNIYAGEDPTIIQMKDSLTGDRLAIVPVRSPEGRISQPRVTPGYQFVPTLMGAVVVLQDDRLQLGSSKDMVIISAKAGQKMLISEAKDRESGLKQALFNPLFNLDIKGLKAKGFTPQRQELQQKIVKEKDPNRRAETMLDLARLNIAQGFGQEALGLLRTAKMLNPVIDQERSYQALRGMAASLADDMPQVETDLKSDHLQSQPAAKLWLGYALARNNQWQKAKGTFFESGTAEDSFPETVRSRLVLAKAETALQTDDMVGADRILKKIPDAKKLRPAEAAAYEFINARIAANTDHKEAAIEMYDGLTKGNDRLYRVKSQLEIVAQKLAAKDITLDKAIEMLERLRFSWRGDRLEIDILQRLGQYYVDNKQYMEGLTVWRQAASLSQNSEDTDAITQNMKDVFKKLYVDGDADKLQPLQAVAVFERFRELIPPGQEGMIALERLADRLASVDLMDEADVLLDKQLRQLPPGEDAAKMGAKLASWRLQNENAAKALEVLDSTAQEQNISEKLSQRRLLLRSRALADVGRVDEALALLNTVQTDEALSLKADINWQQNRWGDALVALQGLVNSARNRGETAVDGPMPTLVMKMAIALTLDGNLKGMELLTAQYGEFMAQTPQAESFAFITKPSRGSSLADMDTLKTQVGEVELFQKFLKDFGK